VSENFFVFSLPRCGSTTLRRLLNCHPRIRCLEEPFNPFNYGKKYVDQVTDPPSLDETLRGIWSTYNGIKHTWYPDGWPFNNKAFNELLMLRRNQRVLYLNRRNLLRRLVSNHISNQTNVWGLFNEQDRERVARFKFAPINIAATKWRLDWERRMVAHYRQMLVNHGATFLELWYEDLYNPSIAPQDRFNGLDKIFAFLGEATIADESALAQVNKLFDSSRMKLNSIGTYLRIPGIEELEKQCGSDETGWLFKEPE
jgi:hypothetical protein